MTYNISITPGQAIVRHATPPVSGFPASEWTTFCNAYDRIVVVPYRRAKIIIAVAFLIQLVILMATMTLTQNDTTPTATLFLIGPCAFGVVAGAALVYMFTIYPKVSHQLQTLCEETSQRVQRHNLLVHYKHNDVHHDLSDHVIQIMPLLPDIETGVPAASTSEWNPLLKLQSLWNRTSHDH